MNDEKKDGGGAQPQPQQQPQQKAQPGQDGDHRRRRRPHRRRHSGQGADNREARPAGERGQQTGGPQRQGEPAPSQASGGGADRQRQGGRDQGRPAEGGSGQSRHRRRMRDDRPRDDRPRDDRPRDGRPRDDRPRDGRPIHDRPRHEADSRDRGERRPFARDNSSRDRPSRDDMAGGFPGRPAGPEQTEPIQEPPFVEEDYREQEAPHRGYEDMTEDQLTYLKSVKLDDDDLLEDLPEHDFEAASNLMDVVGVKLHTCGPVILFDCQDMYLAQGDKVVVETGRGLALGEVLVPARRRLMGGEKLPRVVRKATSSDMRQQQRNEDREDAAYRLCKDRIERLGLPMKLTKVEYLHGGNKAVFYFSADGRIDFRELVRDLAKRLHTRIEMRQIGVRDASRMLGGVGACGCQLCCNLYLREFQPVSIRMAKDQNLILNPQKVSGICGRLLCCLIYEDEAYRETARGMPRVGRRVITPDGEGRIRDRDVLRHVVRVQLNEETALREYTLDKIQLPSQDDSEVDTEPEPKLDIPEDAGTIPEQ